MKEKQYVAPLFARKETSNRPMILLVAIGTLMFLYAFGSWWYKHDTLAEIFANISRW